jgi:hypothetical protein
MTDTTQTEQSKNKALPLFILLFLASLALCAFLFFKYAKNAATLQDQNEELVLAYESLNLSKDSIENNLAITEQKLQDRISEILAQEDLKQDLRRQLVAKSRSLAAARSKIAKLISGQDGSSSPNGPKNLLEAQNQIKQLEKSNKSYITKVEETQKNYVAAKADADKNKALAIGLKKIQDSISSENLLLSNKLEAANLLRVIGFSVAPMREKRGKTEITDKASKVERIKFTFVVQGSTLIEKGQKAIIIRILSPNGTVLTKNTNKLTDSEDLFSLDESITYDGTEKGVTLYYNQEAEYGQGSYTAELWHEGTILDRKKFSLR